MTLQQAAGSGLTAIATIAKAIRRHPKFYWGRLALMFPEETQKVIGALRLIANNPYYGFNSDLGVVKSSGYPDWAWATKELLIKVDGDSSLQMRRTFNPSSKIIMINRTRSKAILLSGRGPEMPLKNMSKRRLKSLKKMKEAKKALIKIMLTD